MKKTNNQLYIPGRAIQTDTSGNKLYMTGKGIYLKTKGAYKDRQLFSFSGGRVLRHTRPGKASSVSLNYYALKMLMDSKLVKRKEISVIAGSRNYVVDIAQVLEAENLYMVGVGYDRQVFWRLNSE